ncbi:hypothetical protein BT67DRAFT_21237 [Trichocladium antarcticum]|uniref:Uncharacterized protein n=1 Tax=Trichocladium antarcticum TaxID=1450529 RepID=A0AAN6UTQ5_9PEZI|nr:hypothetical protein BT67DRAFT_21237 [Trichocladium antarcticum]
MGPPPLSLKRAVLLSAFFAVRVIAQNNDNNDDGAAPAETTTAKENPPATTTARITSTSPAPAKTTPTTTARETSTKEEDESSSEPSSSTSAPPLPALSSSTPTGTRSKQTGMPSVTKTVDTAVPEYPAPTIPPTHNAPFMNHSTLPDGTVFIAVGAILGAFGLAVLAWRGIVACLLHRSVGRAAMAQHHANNGLIGGGGGGGGTDKNAASFPAPPAQFYKYIERESSASLGGAGLAGGSGVRRTQRGPIPSSTPSQTNLFFSPTAAGSSSGLAGGSGSNRDSARFLPSGFYASAAPGPAPGSGGGSSGGHARGNSISMSTLRPASHGRGLLGPSPPESPDAGPRVVSRNFSTSSLNLNRPPSPGARTPSAYLDDLLDEQPGMFPPAAGGGSPGWTPPMPPLPNQGPGQGGRGGRF